jgi:hypothetical protein
MHAAQQYERCTVERPAVSRCTCVQCVNPIPGLYQLCVSDVMLTR